MCGYIAYFSDKPVNNDLMRLGLDLMINRGPDDKGEYVEEGVFMGHRRLAIIDLDNRSSQPMMSNCGQYVIIFNGEIYNYVELKKELVEKGCKFRTNSDTEVLLELFKSEGEKMLPKLKGMFSFLFWDIKNKVAFAARDPYGIKPLYIGFTENGLILGSQVKAIIGTKLINSDRDLQGEIGYWMLGSVPEPNTWFKNIKTLEAGSYITIKKGIIQSEKKWFEIGVNWNRQFEAINFNEKQLIEKVHEVVLESVQRHIVSDVPVGIFLSGGIDSGVLAALMVEAGSKTTIGITLSFDEFINSQHDETLNASILAKHYNIEHHIRKVTKEELYSDLPRIFKAMDQPTIDGINTWYACKAASELGLKVVISGVGGDELFFGYKSFKELPILTTFSKYINYIPFSRRILSVFFVVFSKITKNSRWSYFTEWIKSIGGAWFLRRSVYAPCDLKMLVQQPNESYQFEKINVNSMINEMVGELNLNPILALGQIESKTYLKNQLLRDSDWASMDHSVELRSPLVDVSMLNRLSPYLFCLTKHPNKRILALIPKMPLPKEILQKKKTGFNIPISEWIKKHSNNSNLNWPMFVKEHYELGLNLKSNQNIESNN